MRQVDHGYLPSIIEMFIVPLVRTQAAAITYGMLRIYSLQSAKCILNYNSSPGNLGCYVERALLAIIVKDMLNSLP